MRSVIRHCWDCLRPSRLRGRGKQLRPRRRAVMLILVLWIVVILSLLAYSLIYQMTLETRLTSARKKTFQAKALARAGLAKGFVDLRNDLIADLSDETEPPFDAEGDYWADPEDKEEVELGDGEYTVIVEDAERYFNLNTFKPSNRILLQKIIEQIGYEEEDAKIVASAIIDYADEDDAAAVDSAPGTEGFTYGFYRAEDLGMSKRDEDIEEVVFPNEPYLTVDALLDVYGVTPDLYFGPGSPEAEYYNQNIEGKQYGKRFQIKKRRSSHDDEIVGLRDFFTVKGLGTINMNTVPLHVLTAYLDAAGRPDAERVADKVIRDRRGGSARRIDNDSAFKTVGDLQKNGTLASMLGPMQAMHPFDVRSSVFTLTSTGVIGQVRSTLQVTVTRSMEELQRVEDFDTKERARERDERYKERSERWNDKEDELLVRIPSIRILEWNSR